MREKGKEATENENEDEGNVCRGSGRGLGSENEGEGEMGKISTFQNTLGIFQFKN